MICMKNLRFSSRPGATVGCEGPPGTARAQSCVMQSGFQLFRHVMQGLGADRHLVLDHGKVKLQELQL